MNTDIDNIVAGGDPVGMLQELIRFNTVNPPGNEEQCVKYIQSLLANAGIEAEIYTRNISETAGVRRPNLVCRLLGSGHASPLLLYGHVDVVPVEGQVWSRDAFGGELIDGLVYGRGALDMKSGVAMMVSAILRAKSEGVSLSGDVILAILSDEENGGHHGAEYLVENHPELFNGVRYAIGEFGGVPRNDTGRRVYHIQVAEKHLCWIKATITGPGGHSSMPFSGGAMSVLAEIIGTLDRSKLPYRITPAAKLYLSALAEASEEPVRSELRRVLDPATVQEGLARLGPLSIMFEAVLRNTINPTVVRGGNKTNVIPSEIIVEFDARLVPGATLEDLTADLSVVFNRPIVLGRSVPWAERTSVQFDPLQHRSAMQPVDMGLFPVLQQVLAELEPNAAAAPWLLFASTDASHFSRLGIQTYGFLPMNLPNGFDLLRYVHSADECVPTGAVEFGTQALYDVLCRFGKVEGRSGNLGSI